MRSRSQVGGTGALADSLAAKTAVTPSIDGATGHSINRIPRDEPGTRVNVHPGEERAPGPAEATPTIKAPPPLYQSANLGDGVRPDFDRIVETIYAADVFADYDDLERNLEVGEQRGDYGTLREHLDKAEQRARRAHRLYLGAKIELVRWEVDAKRVMGALRQKAREALEEEKADGTRKKAITIQDVEDWISENHPDEWAAQEVRRAKIKGTVDDLEHLNGAWVRKCSDLRTLIETLRK